MFYKTLRTLDDHLGYPFVVLREFIKRRINNLHLISFDGFFHIRYFLRPLINQKHQQMHVRMVLCNCLCNLFQKCGFPGFRLGYNHTALSLADR